MFWRQSYPSFCIREMPGKKNMLNRFFDIEKYTRPPKSIFLSHIHKLFRVLFLGGHLRRHFKYFNFP